MIGKYDHVGIVVKDVDNAVKFYSEVIGWRMPEKGPYSKILHVDVPGEKIKYAMLSAGDTYIELIEPQEGLWLEYLEQRGEGAMCELCVVVDDIEKARDDLQAMGIEPMDRFNEPLKENYMEAPSGSRYFYLPPQDTFGTWIEILQRPWKQ